MFTEPLSFALLLVAAPAPGALQAEIPRGDLAIRLEPVATGLTAPLGVTHANDGSGRRFVWDQAGQVWIVDRRGRLLPTPFLDLSDRLPELGTFFDERGLLGLAFHPRYRQNGRFFVRYSAPRDGAPEEPCFDSSFGCHAEVLSEFRVSDDPDLADPASERLLFSIDEPQFNHDAGTLAFGPDGFLYFSLGDGGGANDGLSDVPPSHGPSGHGQDVETALGAMLRIDVDGPPAPGKAYGVPPDNPFVGGPGLDEIFAYGFRNPYKFSFDDGRGGDGSLWVADVGQNLFEEIAIVRRGENHGWVLREGFACFDPFSPDVPPATCADAGPLGEPLIDPIAAYAHPFLAFEPTVPVGGITIVGGFVYRGQRARSLRGQYVFGDFAQAFTLPSGRLYHLPADKASSGADLSSEMREFVLPRGRRLEEFVKGFGEDERGELYLCSSIALAPFGRTGVVSRIVALGGRDFRVRELAGENEVPRVRSDARGAAHVTLRGNGQLGFRLEVEDIAGVVAAHIHLGAPDENGPVVAFLFSDPGGVDVEGKQLLARGTLRDEDVIPRPELGFDGTVAGLTAWLRAGGAYVNVHTLANPGGEIRGQFPVSDRED